jgi:2-phosphosulfolactate phosphatase
MKPSLNVYSLPLLVEPEELVGSTVLVIDVLRGTTTITYALEAGAEQVIPCLEVDDAKKLAEQFPAGEFVLGGERNGVLIEGFDLGNSPEDYSVASVGGKTVIFTTTNGTRALLHARQADEVFPTAFVNAGAVVAKLLERENISILCSGTDGQISNDDVLLAGMLVDRIQRQSGGIYQENAQALTARETWLHAFALPQSLGAEPLGPDRLAQELGKSLGGKNLIALELFEDILAAARIDAFDIVPRFDTKTLRITKADG